MISHAVQSVFAILTAIYLLLAAGSCSSMAAPADQDALTHNSGTSIGVSTIGASISVNVLQSMPEISYPLQLATEEYVARREQNSDTTFHIQTIAGKGDYCAALRSRILAGETVDMFHITGASDAERLSAYLEDLSWLQWLTGATAGTLDVVQRNDQILGVPYALEGVGLIANRRIFDTAGITLSDCHDFSSLEEALVRLRDKIDAGELSEQFPNLEAVSEIAAQDSAYLSEQYSELLLTGVFSSPTQAYRASTFAATGAESSAEEFVKLMARMSPHRGSWAGLAGVTQNQLVEGGLAAERVAVVLQSTEVYRRIIAVNPDLEQDLALLPVYLPDEEEGILFAGASVWWSIRKEADTDVKSAAVGFLEWLYQSEAGSAVLAGEFGALSPFRDVASSTGVALHSQLYRTMDRADVRPRLAAEAPEHWGEEVFAEQLREYFTVYDKTWEDVVKTCETGWMERRSQP